PADAENSPTPASKARTTADSTTARPSDLGILPFLTRDRLREVPRLGQCSGMSPEEVVDLGPECASCVDEPELLVEQSPGLVWRVDVQDDVPPALAVERDRHLSHQMTC